MEMPSPLVTIITSAAVASLVAALAQFVGARLEARARRRELLLTRALDLAQARTEMVMRIAKETGGTGVLMLEVLSRASSIRLPVWRVTRLVMGRVLDGLR